MLCLTRKIGERIKVGPDVWITLVAVEHGRAIIGLEAPKEVGIFREEILPVPEQRQLAEAAK